MPMKPSPGSTKKITQLEEQVLPTTEPQPKSALKQQLPSRVAEMVQATRKAVREGTDADGMLPAVRILERLGLLPSHARWLSGQARNFLGFTKPRNLPEEFTLVRETLTEYWHQLIRRHTKPGNPARLFVGTPWYGQDHLPLQMDDSGRAAPKPSPCARGAWTAVGRTRRSF